MNRLLDIGFIPVGHWTLNSNAIKSNLISHHTTINILYSFISNGDIKYIGKTTTQLSNPKECTVIKILGHHKEQILGLMLPSKIYFQMICQLIFSS